jgi:Ca2+/H+ antiporter, TMEM165/GDT1 family
LSTHRRVRAGYLIGEQQIMNLEKVVFSFFIVLALTLNFGFFLGDIDNPAHHNVYELFAAIVVNLIATVLKFGERTQMGTVLLATSLVADLELIAAAIVWTVAVHITGTALTPADTATIVSLAGGALVANTVSVVLLVVDMAMTRR